MKSLPCEPACKTLPWQPVYGSNVRITELQHFYLDLVERSLLGQLSLERFAPIATKRGSWKWFMLTPLQRLLSTRGLAIAHRRSVDDVGEVHGGGWSPGMLTLLGPARLDNIRSCVETVISERVPGDLIETGVWRGGAVILMRALLRAHSVTDRKVWVADSFAGLPRPNGDQYPADRASDLYKYELYSASLKDVQGNFARFGLLDDQVRFLPGWFSDTLPGAPIKQLSVLRLDGDLYESTITALESLYSKVSPGGFVIVDDYHSHKTCHLAVSDFRSDQNVTEPIEDIDEGAVFWRVAAKSKS